MSDQKNQDRALIRIGMMKAANILRQAARDHDRLAAATAALAGAEGEKFAAVILRNYADGLEARAEADHGQ